MEDNIKLDMLKPAFEKSNIAVILAADEPYGKYLLVTLTSLAVNTSSKNNYDIVILDGGLNEQSKLFINRLAADNISIRYFDISAFMREHAGLFRSTVSHITIATYYRFFIPKIIPDYDKVVYLDSDLVLEGDVAELYNQDLRGKLLAGVHDPYPSFFQDKTDFADYVRRTLGLADIGNYFNAGVLLMNIRRMVAEGFTDKCLECMMHLRDELKFQDQCVLNALCANDDFTLLPDRYNLMWQYVLPVNVERVASPDASRDYRGLYDRSPFIVHYTTFRKPWQFMPSDTGNWPGVERWWKYARQTPCYEYFLSMILRPSDSLYSNLKIKLFGLLTLFRIKTDQTCQKWYLLNFIQFLHVKKVSGQRKWVFLFGLPLFTIKD